MITTYRRGRTWWGYDSNGRKRFSLHTRFKDVAGKKAARMELEADAGVKAIPWPEFQAEFLAWAGPHLKPHTASKYKFVADRFGRFYDGPVAHIDSATITGYVKVREGDTHPTRGTSISAEGIKSDLRILRLIFSYATDAGYIKQNPVKVARLNSLARDTQPFSAEEVERMLSVEAHGSTRADLKTIVQTFLGTGFRISDIIGLEKRAVDWKGNRITWRTIKRGKPVSVPLHPVLRNALKEHLARQSEAQKASPLLFPTESGNPSKNLDAYLRRLWDRAGIEGGHAHRFRDTFAVNLLSNGASLYDVAKMLGITVAVAERHYAPYVEELQERAARLVQTLKIPA